MICALPFPVKVKQGAQRGLRRDSVYSITYPNPATDGVSVEFNYGKDVVLAKEILVYNQLGQMVYQQNVPENSPVEFIDFNQTSITSGTYTIQVMDMSNGILATDKIVVQR